MIGMSTNRPQTSDKAQKGKTYHQECLTVEGAAAWLGVSTRTVRDLLKDDNDPLPHFRIGRKILRVRIADLQAWTQRRRVDVAEVDRTVSEIIETFG
jgi:excisionase family DNA binding protein